MYNSNTKISPEPISKSKSGLRCCNGINRFGVRSSYKRIPVSIVLPIISLLIILTILE